jgi:hypothetical protein
MASCRICRIKKTTKTAQSSNRIIKNKQPGFADNAAMNAEPSRRSTGGFPFAGEGVARSAGVVENEI